LIFKTLKLLTTLDPAQPAPNVTCAPPYPNGWRMLKLAGHCVMDDLGRRPYLVELTVALDIALNVPNAIAPIASALGTNRGSFAFDAANLPPAPP
jgi:hypothetical protein